MTEIDPKTPDLDAGWDDEEAAESELDKTWDSLVPPPVSLVPVSAEVVTGEVDVGWDDAPEPGVAQPSGGKRRPHRQRRAQTKAAPPSANPIVAPRPAEPTKKSQRELSRQRRGHEAERKEQAKLARKAERAEEARVAAAERLRQAEEEERARQVRRAARERAQSERPASQSRRARPEAEDRAGARAVEPKRSPGKAKLRGQPSVAPSSTKPRLRLGVIITLGLAAVIAALLLLKK